MKWIKVSDRVPDDRRKVIAWGMASWWVGLSERSQFLGETRFNLTKSGGNFDVELNNRLSWCRVTHWAEIEGPTA